MTKFKSGQSGNPAGRPKGAGRMAKLRTMLEPHAEDLLKKVVDLAKAGDMTAIRLCLERLIPPLKATDEPVTIHGLNGALTEKGGRIIEEMSHGVLTPSETVVLLQALAAQARIIEIDELQRRVEALEEK